LKIDAIGFEGEVLKGAQQQIADPSILAVLIRLCRWGLEYGYDEDVIHANMLAAGWRPHRYEAFSRKLVEVAARYDDGQYTIYCRATARAQELVRTAPKFRVNGIEV